MTGLATDIRPGRLPIRGGLRTAAMGALAAPARWTAPLSAFEAASGFGKQRLGSLIALLMLLLLLIAGCSPTQLSGRSGDAAVSGKGTPVTRWSLAADRFGRNTANWRTMAIMHIAMHDALNAAEPRFARWSPASRDEPVPDGASPGVAMAAAAHWVLMARHHGEAAEDADRLLRLARSAEPSAPAVEAGLRLGGAIGRATVARYPEPPSSQPFPVRQGAGQWRPTPPYFENDLVSNAMPFLFEGALVLRGPPPPRLGSPRYVADVEEVRRLGGWQSAERSSAQAEAAGFWAQQSSQRNFIHLASAMMQEQSPDIWTQARFMSQLAAALADSFIISWEEKRHWAVWRPVTALNLGSEGVPADPGWNPMFNTPPHPDYPSGHATDCATGARVMEGFPGRLPSPVAFTAADRPDPLTRHFPDLKALANECAESRIWAGAHFRTANEEGQRLAALITRRALMSVPPLKR
jgi:hypothetical protein